MRIAIIMAAGIMADAVNPTFFTEKVEKMWVFIAFAVFLTIWDIIDSTRGMK